MGPLGGFLDPSRGMCFVVIVTLLSFSSISKAEDDTSRSKHYAHRRNEIKGMIERSTLFDDCDIDSYYRDQRDVAQRWNREEIASLLLRSHRQVVPLEASSEFMSGRFDESASTTFRTYATVTDTRGALTDLDRGNSVNRRNVDTKTVRMIFTQTDIPVDEDLTMGWEPGYLWPVDDLKFNSTDNYENQREYNSELSAAIRDLHNIRPRHSRIYHDHLKKNWFYDSCNDCEFGQRGETAQKRFDATASVWEGIEFDLQGSNQTSDTNEGSDHLCVCTRQHALQPPEDSRGEIARALLYMNLRYGTLTAAHAKRAVRRKLGEQFLDLALTDCPPIGTDDSYGGGDAQNTNNLGYFSRLVQWHRENPPSQREIERNEKVCRKYQGNRNPFVDFYEESWALLDFDRIEREVCAGKGNGDQQWERDDDSYYDDDSVSVSAGEPNSDAGVVQEPESDESDGFDCSDLIAGDISFFMVQPATDSDESNDWNQDEEWQRESFGLVTLVKLKPGLVLYVAGVDEGQDQLVSNGEGYIDRDQGIIKVEMPEKGVPAGSYFGYGKRLYLGNEWEPVVEATEVEDYRFSVHQLYLYCIDKTEDTSVTEEYKMLAALSTTGTGFGQNGLPSYWENFEKQHNNAVLSENFNSGLHYGLIVLPADASSSEISGGYRYMGPAYTKHDQYAKALIDEANWKRMNSLDGDMGVYGRMGEDTNTSTSTSTNENDTIRGRVDATEGNAKGINSSGNTPHAISRIQGSLSFCLTLLIAIFV